LRKINIMVPEKITNDSGSTLHPLKIRQLLSLWNTLYAAEIYGFKKRPRLYKALVCVCAFALLRHMVLSFQKLSDSYLGPGHEAVWLSIFVGDLALIFLGAPLAIILWNAIMAARSVWATTNGRAIVTIRYTEQVWYPSNAAARPAGKGMVKEPLFGAVREADRAHRRMETTAATLGWPTCTQSGTASSPWTNQALSAVP